MPAILCIFQKQEHWGLKENPTILFVMVCRISPSQQQKQFEEDT